MANVHKLPFFKGYLFVSLLLILSSSAFAQILEPIKWSTSLSSIESGKYQLTIKATIEDGWHLYGMKLPEGGPVPTTITFDKLSGIQLIGSIKPTSTLISQKDPIFNLDLNWYSNEAVFIQQFSIVSAKDFLLKGTIRFMGCNDESCLPPTPENFEFNAASIASLVKTSDSKTEINTQDQSITSDELVATPASVELNSAVSEQKSTWKPVINEIRAMNASNATSTNYNSWWYLLIAGFIGGLLALLTPCVWPIIPMTVSFFLKRNTNKRKAVREALLYGVSIIVIYLILGLGITLIFGASALNSLATNAFFNLLFFAILVVFAISFFGAFELVLPAS